MQTGNQPDTSEPALVTALVAPLVKLRSSLGDGTRPDDAGLSAMSAVPQAIRASDDTHRLGITPLAATDTAAAAVPVLEKTGGEVAALSEVAPAFSPLLTSAYGVRDKAAAALDSLISNFRTQATPLVNSARSQADLDAVVTLAADHLQSGVSVVKAADGEMDALTYQLKQDQPQVSTPGATPGQPGLAVPASGQPGLAVSADTKPDAGANEQNPTLVVAHPKSSTVPDSGAVPDPSAVPAADTPAETDPPDDTGGGDGSAPDADTNSPPVQTDPLLAAQQAIQNALSAATQAITTGIQQAETALTDALAGGTSPQPDGATPAPADTTPLTPDQSPSAPPQSIPPSASVPDPGAVPDPSPLPDYSAIPDPSPVPDPGHGGAPVPPITADPKPGNDIQQPRDGQAGVTSIPAPGLARDGQAGVTPISPAPTGHPRDGQAGVTSPPNTP
ncbi:hypothetical protein ACFXHA_36750 [Nocardia sp. NPDC059240]|uniref:hypothetical protein n=1 Tax=Nocardia sp. NPDC059240 TaxID=3346786 RepID=UPI00369F17EC